MIIRECICNQHLITEERQLKRTPGYSRTTKQQCVPGFVCGTSGLGDDLGLEGTRRLSMGPVEMSKVLNLLLRMMIQHISFNFSAESEINFLRNFLGIISVILK